MLSPLLQTSIRSRIRNEKDICRCIGERRDVAEASDVFQPGHYIACTYDRDWYVGNIIEISEEHNDCLVDFMRRRNTTLSWPPATRRDKCWVPRQHIICAISAPKFQGRSSRNYTFSAEDYDRIHALNNGLQ